MSGNPGNASTPDTVAAHRVGTWRRARSLFEQFFFGRRRMPADPLLDVLPKFDVEALLSEMQIREKAAENGRHEIPGTTDVQPDGPHALIVQRVEQAIREGKSVLETHLSNLTRRIQAVDVVQDCSALRALPASLEHDLGGLTRRHAERVAPLRQRQRELRSQLLEFREKFGIRYGPRAPRSHVLHVGVLLAIVLGESLLNGRYLARADELGLLGGVTNALVIALVNVVISFFLGRMTAWTAGARVGFRLVGVAAGLVFLFWVFAYNFTIAHARDLLVQSADYSAMLRGLGQMLDAPFTFTDVGSWLLLSLGMLFSIVSFVEGLGWDDPTFGYRSLHQRFEQAREDYLDERQQLDVEGRQLFARRVAELHEGADRVRYRVDSLRNDVEQKRLLVVKAVNFFRFAERSCNTMLSVYRDLNRRQRKTEPPSYFQHAWSPPSLGIAETDLAPDLARAEAQAALWQDLARDRETLTRNLETVHAAYVTRAKALRDEDDDALDAAAESLARA